jgi:protein-tyrosine kinase
MEQIRQAVERARVTSSLAPQRLAEAPSLVAPQVAEIELDTAWLLSNRIVSHDAGDLRSRPYDILRTQVLRSMDQNGWRILGVTSATPGCGKTVTALNLAFSIARMPDRTVGLAELDLRKPDIARCLGLPNHGAGLVDVVQGRASLQETAIVVRAGTEQVRVLLSKPTKGSSELMASRAMQDLLLELKREHHFVVVDLPPILSGDDVLCVLPHIDCVLLVAAVGLSKASEVEESVRHLESTQIIRLVLNKDSETRPTYYY